VSTKALAMGIYGLLNLGVKSSYVKEILVVALAFMSQERIVVKLYTILVATLTPCTLSHVVNRIS
jgi:hypothetical protein